jgi:hypothetical protein
MSTVIRPEVSEKNKYWISKHRYYELKHFCLQYPDWKKLYYSLDGGLTRRTELPGAKREGALSNPTEMYAIEKAFYSERITMVEQAAKRADESLSPYILKAATEEYSFEYLKMRMGIPCGKDTYYAAYRRFFWYLSKARK